jgi:hypothetical protein
MSERAALVRWETLTQSGMQVVGVVSARTADCLRSGVPTFADVAMYRCLDVTSVMLRWREEAWKVINTRGAQSPARCLETGIAQGFLVPAPSAGSIQEIAANSEANSRTPIASIPFASGKRSSPAWTTNDRVGLRSSR